ncbi:hypothetical protein ILUMI_07840 [Ignelater luminosus]|uniref:Reverse transcriptase Ty1/copia-type domain-containing protein n=1 Tax=Ignelater luminosus TaxID=2038154 RepID=A0A8K0GGG8_IGNLU|nr:hypothetical protein ILUMI_07840 [Ignelater luminosus]
MGVEFLCDAKEENITSEFDSNDERREEDINKGVSNKYEQEQTCELRQSNRECKLPHWRPTMNKEIECLSKNKTWELVVEPENKNVLDAKWVYKKKLEKYKARCVNHSSKTIDDDGEFEVKFEIIFRNADRSGIMEYLAGLIDLTDMDNKLDKNNKPGDVKRNLIASFNTTGIVPFNPNQVQRKLSREESAEEEVKEDLEDESSDNDDVEGNIADDSSDEEASEICEEEVELCSNVVMVGGVNGEEIEVVGLKSTDVKKTT